MTAPMRSPSLVTALLFLASTSLAAEGQAGPEARKVAETYLKAVTGDGDEVGRDLLLGGATMNAKLFSLENWRIVSEEPVRREQAELSSALHMMSELDQASRAALAEVVGSTGDSAEPGISQISQSDAARLLGPTQEKAQRLLRAHPVLAYVARVGKEVYWHPKNPARAMLASAGTSGPYTVELYLFNIETREGPRQVPRQWPLRVLRFRTAKLDTGWKVLPASDWNAE
jgi:hypothetical protein